MVKKSDTITWLVCSACKQPVGWWEDVDAPAKRRLISEENARKWV